MTGPSHVARRPARPVMLFDDDCAFCRRWIARWRQATGERVEYLPYQSESVAAEYPELPKARLEKAVHLIGVDGRIFAGAEAVVRALQGTVQWPAWCYDRLPGIAPVMELAYAMVASNRRVFSFGTRLLWGTHVERPTHYLTRWLFLRLLGAVYLCAFWSLGTQILGLSGSRGIVPAGMIMEAMGRGLGDAGPVERFLRVPTLCWWDASDDFLRGQCVVGGALAVVLMAGFAPGPCLALLWLLYLSLATVTTVFLGYQWDNLLLEAGLLAVFFAPWRLWPNLAREAPPSRLVLWLLRWLIFRLMFASGWVKLLSDDALWKNLTALTVHYETQPLPTALGWYAHQLPVWFQKLSCGVMFAIELALPLLVFLTRRPRFIAFWAFVGLMLLIALTGNYAYFNLLTIVLCVPLLDDFAVMRWLPARWRDRVGAPAHLATRWARWPAMRWGRRTVTAGLFLVVAALSVPPLAGLFHRGGDWPVALREMHRWASPFRSVSGYGLFSVMTPSRPEIVLEGSEDGRNWVPYEFKDKPGDVRRPPPWVAPHQPRLDWQMWFAALGDVRSNPWFVNFCHRVLQGSPDVLALLAKNPFPDRPPRFVRAGLWEYRFTTMAQRRATGAWWRREFKAYYLDPISLALMEEAPLR